MVGDAVAPNRARPASRPVPRAMDPAVARIDVEAVGLARRAVETADADLTVDEEGLGRDFLTGVKLQVLVDGGAGTEVLAQLRPDVVVTLPDTALKESAQRADKVGKLFSERPVAGLVRAAHPLTSGEVV